MTDVRLTALNPVDSQVYPVACNTSGELLVADGGPDLEVEGDLTVDGSSTFKSKVDITPTTAGTGLEIEGVDSATVILQAKGTTSSANTFLRMISGGTNANNYILLGDGGDSNAGGIQYNHQFDFLVFRSGDADRVWFNGNGNVFIAGSSPTSAKIALNADGTASFDGNITAPNINQLTNAISELQTKVSMLQQQQSS